MSVPSLALSAPLSWKYMHIKAKLHGLLRVLGEREDQKTRYGEREEREREGC